MSPIENYNVYTNGMKKALYDKLFFVDKINPSMIVDFGCADGTLMRETREYFPDIPIIGVDNDAQMRESVKGFEVLSDLSEVEPEKGSALILSSVLHELYSYSSFQDIVNFWEYADEFDYIVIRDMAISDNSALTVVPEGEPELLRNLYPEQAKDFEKIWGSLAVTKNFLHFLLKYKYTENWKRELHEDYLINTSERIQSQVNNKSIVYKEHCVLPYLKDTWGKEFGVNVKTPTHLKLIVKNEVS